MTYFLDTSALVKIYHKEEGSENVLDVYKRENMNISELSIVEFLSTAYRKHREKEIDELTLNAVWSKFNEDLETQYDVIPFSAIIIEKACDLIHKHGGSKSLRTLDSLQLAFFLIYCDRQEDIFLCADKRLLEIAIAEGVLIMDALAPFENSEK